MCKEAFVYLQIEVIIVQISHLSALHSSACSIGSFSRLHCPILARTIEEIRLFHFKRWAIWWNRVPNAPEFKHKDFWCCPKDRHTSLRQVAKVAQSRTNVLKLNQPAAPLQMPTCQLCCLLLVQPSLSMKPKLPLNANL